MAHDATPEEFGEAVSLCQGYTPECSQSGVCQRDGTCFSVSGRGFGKAIALMDDLIKAEQYTPARMWLKIARDALTYDKFMEDGLRLSWEIMKAHREVMERFPRGKCP